MIRFLALLLILILPSTAFAAIAHDSSASNATAVSSTSGSFTFTNTAGTSCYLFISGQANATVVQKMTMTKGGVDVEMTTSTPMFTAFVSIWNEMFHIISPDTGTVTVKWQISTANLPNFSVECLTGAATTNTIGSTYFDSLNGFASFSMSTTTQQANSWIFAGLFTNGNRDATMAVSGTGQTLRGHTGNAANGTGVAGSTQTTTAAGSYTSTFTWTTNDAVVGAIIEIKEATAAAAAPTEDTELILFN